MSAKAALLAVAAPHTDFTDPAFARALDEKDPLSKFRSQFHYPLKDPENKDSGECIYLCGNSLGLQSLKTRQYVMEEMDVWAASGVRGHFASKRAWAKIDDVNNELMAEIVGAKPSEVALMNGLTVNLHLMMVAFYRPTQERFKIIMEVKPFPSDLYAVQSQIRHHGFDPEVALVFLKPREGEETLRTEDICASIKEHGPQTALVLISGVQYYTGQAFDIPTITAVGKEAGCRVGWDLAHAVGNVPMQLHDWDVDFACWCTYKYLNSGPGGLAGIFVHEKHGRDASINRFSGWWGHHEETRFDMTKPFQAVEGARGFQLSNPPILQAVSLLGSLEVFHEAGGVQSTRAKSELITGYLEILLMQELGEKYVRIITPSESRGCQLSLVFTLPIRQVFEKISAKGVVCDMREPDVMRIAPAPLYNSYSDVLQFVLLLRDSLLEA